MLCDILSLSLSVTLTRYDASHLRNKYNLMDF